jgi:kynurenine formamidase
VGRTADGSFAQGWEPPRYTVDENGKIRGLANQRSPNNWGRWGDLDQRGTANLITPEKIVQAAALIRTGEVISCAIPLHSSGPVHPSRPRVTHLFSYTGADFVAGSPGGVEAFGPQFQGADDYVFMPLQGSTQWDGLAHFFVDDAMYNGFWMGNVDSFAGARRNAIGLLRESLVGRGVLLDVARQLDTDRIPEGHAITPGELDATCAAEGVEVAAGDILLIRTGHIPYYYQLKNKAEFWSRGAPGIGAACIEWLARKDVAALAVDNISVGVNPHEDDGPSLHGRLITDLGLTIGEVWWLEELAESCARDGRYEFFISAPPLYVPDGVGSPINPVAIK